MIKISDTEYFSNDRTIRFLNCDCNEFMKGLKENEIDLNLSDPPYGIGAGAKSFISGTRVQKSNFHKLNDWDLKIPDENIFINVIRTSKNQIIWGGNYMTEFLKPSRGWIVWNKKTGDNSYADGELAWTSFDTILKIYDQFWSGWHAKGKGQKDRIHPTQKPIDLYRWILQNYTKPTDTILDCFGGSMSNAIACHMERRKLTIIELDKDYFDSALKRFDMYERQMKLF